MKKTWFVACCALMVAATSASAATEVYKWKDKNGKMQYSDSPPLTNIPYTTLSGKKSPAQSAPASKAAPAEAAKPAAVPAAGAKPDEKPAAAPAAGEPNPSKDKVSEDLKEKAAKEAEAKKQQEEKLAAEQKAKDQACKAARAKLAQFQQGGRMYRVNEQGEREYYGDKEIAAERENAQDDVAANCE